MSLHTDLLIIQHTITHTLTGLPKKNRIEFLDALAAIVHAFYEAEK